MNPTLEILHNAFIDCLLDDDVSPSEIYDCLMSAIEEEENYFNQQLDRIQRTKQRIQGMMSEDTFWESLHSTMTT